MITKQQEFLDKLIDPNKARLKEAIEYFLAYNENVLVEHTVEYSTGYVVDVMVATLEEQYAASIHFLETFEYFFGNPSVYLRAEWSDNPGSHKYRRSYYIKRP